MYSKSSLLVQELLAAKRDLALPRALKRISGYDVVMITSNLPFSGWERIFKDPMTTTAAAIDRLVHHSIILQRNLPSYRMEQAKNDTQSELEEKEEEEKREE